MKRKDILKELLEDAIIVTITSIIVCVLMQFINP